MASYIDEKLAVRDFDGTALGELTVHAAHTIGQEYLPANRQHSRFEQQQ